MLHAFVAVPGTLFDLTCRAIRLVWEPCGNTLDLPVESVVLSNAIWGKIRKARGGEKQCKNSPGSWNMITTLSDETWTSGRVVIGEKG